jgi:hypothetical protein
MSSKFRRMVSVGAAVLVSLLGVSRSEGAVYHFTNITNNNATDVATGIAQMWVDVTDGGTTTIDSNTFNVANFTFYNDGPNASSITDLYFDDGSLLNFGSVIDGPGTSFTVGASPGELPGGGGWNWNQEGGMHFSVDSDEPPPESGVNPDEYVTIRFVLQDGLDYSDTIAAIDASFANLYQDIPGALRVGIHVQAFDGDGSESFVTAPSRGFIPVVPEPGTMAMWALGLALCGTTGYFRRRQAA